MKGQAKTLKELCIYYMLDNAVAFASSPTTISVNEYEKINCSLSPDKNSYQQQPSSYERKRSGSIGSNNKNNKLSPRTRGRSNSISTPEIKPELEHFYGIPYSTSQIIVNDLCISKRLNFSMLLKLRFSGFSTLNLSLLGRLTDEWMILLRELPLENLNLSHCLITNNALFYCCNKRNQQGKKKKEKKKKKNKDEDAIYLYNEDIDFEEENLSDEDIDLDYKVFDENNDDSNQQNHFSQLYPLAQSLTSLNISNIHEIGYDGFKVIGQNFINLHSICLEGCNQFGNKCLELLCGKNADKQLKRNLTKLNLKRTKISDSGCKYLQGLHNLEYLNIGENPKITNTALVYIKNLLKLTFLGLNKNVRITDDGMSVLKRLNNLKSLSISETYMGDSEIPFRAFKQLSYWNLSNSNFSIITNENNCFSNLTRINLSHCKLLEDNATKKFFLSLNRLIEVNLSSTLVDDDVLYGLISSKDTLQILNINNCSHLTDLSFEHLIPSFINLLELNGRQLKQITVRDGWSHVFKSNTKLEKLCISGSLMNQKIDTFMISGFKELKNLINLRVLDLSCSLDAIIDEMLTEVIPKLNQLNWLDLSHCNLITGLTIDCIVNHLLLTHLAISYCKSIGAEYIQKLSKLINLECLYISGSEIKSDDLSSLTTLKNLTDLSLMDCKKLKKDGSLKELKQFADKLIMLNLYGIKLTEYALQHLKPLQNLVTLRMSVHDELEDMNAVYDLPNLVYLKTKRIDQF
ncbi:hypothetical protein ABK040_015604 [Willaertia magna]